MLVVETQISVVPAGEYLDLLRALASELDRAMLAIARNDLSELEDSIATQQSLCSHLSRMSEQVAQCSRHPAGSAQSIDSGLKRQIHDATGELNKLNQRYHILLKHSSRSAQMMAMLFKSYRGQIKDAPGQGQQNQAQPDRKDSQWEA
jgi:flagellar biosynthesis/type III secretory pathway chaperone